MTKKLIFKVENLLLVVFIIVFSLSISGCEVSEKYQKTVQLSKPLGPGKQFEVVTHNGSINVNGAETGSCNISAKITGRGPTVEDARHVAESIYIELVFVDDKLIADIKKPAWLEQRYYSIDYDIHLPAATGLNFHTHNGSIQVETITEPINLSTHNGGIDCYNVSGRVYAKTHNGSVNIAYDENKLNTMDTYISTHNGGIEIKTTDKLSAQLNASTHNGSITVSKPVTVEGKIDKNNLRGKIGTGLGSMHLTTHNGAIIIR
jgi:hypothetical protein